MTVYGSLRPEPSQGGPPPPPVFKRRQHKGLLAIGFVFALALAAVILLTTTERSLEVQANHPQSTEDVIATGIGDKHEPNADYEWCFDCKERCNNIITSIQYHNRKLNATIGRSKMAKLASNMNSFFRGTDYIYLEDFLKWPTNDPMVRYTNVTTFVDADQHLSNFGSFHDHKKNLVYDMNDFDEVMIGSYAIDIYRTAVSLLVTAEKNGLSNHDSEVMVRSFAYNYFATVLGYVDNDNELFFQMGLGNTYGAIHKLLQTIEETETRKGMLDKYAPEDPNGKRAFATSKASLAPVSDATVAAIHQAWPGYIITCVLYNREGDENPFTDISDVSSYYEIKSIAEKVGSGMGSLGNKRYYVLIEGATRSNDDDHILDVKLEPEPSFFDYASSALRHLNTFKNNGERILMGYKALKRIVAPTVGYLELGGEVYLVNPRSPWKGEVDLTTLRTLQDFIQVSDQLARASATNHARADNDYRPDTIPWSFEKEFARLTEGNEVAFVDAVFSFATMWTNRMKADFACWRTHMSNV